ncbi:AAA family ATPase [Pseudotabrizicola sp.]|uniref:AAA family ATPase n=1 Tax=Pseudotabrizicola sp. TaxID=2939647 RepID=UPI00272AEDB5|nr:AAA family ATPase [Pseudotabrizicola sp.]
MHRKEYTTPSYDVDGGDDGVWCLRAGTRVQSSQDGRIGVVIKMQKPMLWDDRDNLRPCAADHPEAVFHEAYIAWEDGTRGTEKTLWLNIPDLIEDDFFSASKLKGKPVPPREWLVEGLVPSRTVTLLGGDGGTGKSLLALQLALASVTGGPWITNPVKGGPVVYFSAEDDEDELHRRLDDILQSTGCTYDDVPDLILASYAGKDALLASQASPTAPLQPTPLYKRLDARMAAVKPALLILDTLADLFPGNENDRAQARQFIGLLRALSIKHQCAVVLLAHPSLSGLNSGSGTSGSTGWNNSVRSRLYFERINQDGYEANPDARVLRTMKANYGRTGGEINLTWRNGVFVADAPVTGLDRMAGNAKAERVFMSLLRSTTDQGVKVNPSGGKNYAPLYFQSEPKAEGIKKHAFVSAMKTLLDNGKIRIVTDGPPSKQRQFLQVAE